MEGMYNPGIYAKEVPNNEVKEALNAAYGRSMFPPMCFCSDLGKPIGGFVSHVKSIIKNKTVIQDKKGQVK